MKNSLYILSIIISLITLKSCNINSEIIYHKDKTVSLTTGFNFKEMMEKLNEIKSSESENNDKNENFEKLDKIPSHWTSIYEMEKLDGKDLPTSNDSLQIMKKIFIKRDVENGKSIGISFKMEHFTKKDFTLFNDRKIGNKKGNPLVLNNNIGEWNDNKLIINTANLNFDGFENLNLKNKEKSSTNSKEEGLEKLTGLLQMIKVNYTQKLKFENKIKSIKGKHDWVKQIDDHTIIISYSTENIKNKNSLHNKDNKIIVEVE